MCAPSSFPPPYITRKAPRLTNSPAVSCQLADLRRSSVGGCLCGVLGVVGYWSSDSLTRPGTSPLLVPRKLSHRLRFTCRGRRRCTKCSTGSPFPALAALALLLLLLLLLLRGVIILAVLVVDHCAASATV